MSSVFPDSYLVVIPARYASSRFPGKALADLGGKTVLRRCFEQVHGVVPVDHIVVATDDERIAQECRTYGMPFEMTSTSCLTGTDRVAEVAQRHAAQWFVNVQGDEPFLDQQGLMILLTTTAKATAATGVINAYASIYSETDFQSSTVPKVVVDQQQRLLYISRGSIPTTKGFDFIEAKRQIGMYSFSRGALEQFSACTAKTPLETIEDIEILRFLELGIPVQMISVNSVGIAIDTPEDLARAKTFLAENTRG